MKKIVRFLVKYLHIVEQCRILYRKVRNLDRIEQLHRTAELYRQLHLRASTRYVQLEAWIRDRAVHRDRLTEDSIDEEIQRQNKASCSSSSSS